MAAPVPEITDMCGETQYGLIAPKSCFRHKGDRKVREPEGDASSVADTMDAMSLMSSELEHEIQLDDSEDKDVENGKRSAVM
jgi:hypothetical protein